MSLKITIYDGAIPMLDKIAQISHLSALAALDQAGIELRDQTRKAFLDSKRSEWSVFVVNGKRQWRKTVINRKFGARFNFKKAGPSNMSQMIDSYLMPRTMTLVVAGMHKRFTARKYYQESKTNFEGGAQYAESTGQVLQGSWQILKKLSEGGRFSSLDPKYKGTRMGDDTKPIGENPFYRPRNFIQRGRSASMNKITDIMTLKLESLILKQVNRATVKTQIRAS